MMHPKDHMIFCYIGVSSIIFLLLTLPAYAYIDPGTGSFLIQVIISMLVSAVIGIKLFWTRIKLKFKALFGRKFPGDGDV